MKRFFATLAALTVSLMFLFGAEATPLQQRLRGHIEALCSEEWAGRKAGSEGGAMAQSYIAGELEALHLSTFERAEYFHPFSVALHDDVFRNVVARIEGTNPDQYIVIGAHYDHLGTDRKGAIYRGADDNASGVAVLLEVARLMAESGTKPSCTLIFATFDAEELGLYGSQDLAQRFPEGSVKAMVNMDMVGRLGEGALVVEGVGTLVGAEEIVTSASSTLQLTIKAKPFERTPLVATDTDAFAKRGFATLSLTTGLHDDYHKTTDTPEKIDFEGLEQITLFAYDLVRAIDSNRNVAPSGKVARKHRTGENTLAVGLIYAFGSNRYHFPGSAYEGVEAGAWSAGGSLLYTFKHVGVRTGVRYERLKARVPSRSDNIHSKAQTISHDYITLPLDVMLKTGGVTCGYLFAGGYFSFSLGSRLENKRVYAEQIGKSPYEWGWQWGLGGRIGDFTIEATNRYALSGVYTSTPETLNHTSLCTIGWYF